MCKYTAGIRYASSYSVLNYNTSGFIKFEKKEHDHFSLVVQTAVAQTVRSRMNLKVEKLFCHLFRFFKCVAGAYPRHTMAKAGMGGPVTTGHHRNSLNKLTPMGKFRVVNPPSSMQKNWVAREDHADLRRPQKTPYKQ